MGRGSGLPVGEGSVERGVSQPRRPRMVCTERKGWGREQREAPDVGSTGLSWASRGACLAGLRGHRLLRLSGEVVRGFAFQDEERDLVPEAPGATQGFGAGRPMGSLWQCGKNRLWWVSRKARKPRRWLPEQSWRKTAKHEPGRTERTERRAWVEV